MDKQLSKEEKDLMIQIFGKIVSIKELDEWLEWEDQQRQLELETQRSFPY
jgi:putative heme degradation protein